MRTGVVEANLPVLNDEYRLPYIPELIDRKVHGAEKGTLESAEVDLYRAEYERLTGHLEQAAERTHLPEQPSGREALNDLLVRVRLATLEPFRDSGVP